MRYETGSIIVAVCISAGIYFVPVSTAQGETITVPADIIEGWKRLETVGFANRPLVVVVEETSTGILNGEPVPEHVSTAEVGFGTEGGYFKTHKDDMVEVFATNSQYLFGVSKNRNSEHYNLERSQQGSTARALEMMESRICSAIQPGYAILNVRLLEFLDNPKCTIKSLELDAEDGLVKMELGYSRSPGRGDSALKSATVWLDPAHDYAIRKYRCETELGIYIGEIEYEPLMGTWASTYRHEKTIAKDGSGEAINIWKVSEIRAVDSLPVHLADYGLSDYQSKLIPYSNPSGLFPLIVNVIAVISLFVIYLLRRRNVRI